MFMMGLNACVKKVYSIILILNVLLICEHLCKNALLLITHFVLGVKKLFVPTNSTNLIFVPTPNVVWLFVDGLGLLISNPGAPLVIYD